ncbi:restriction endonuclease subunit S [Halomonas sp. 25-S5]|uniref:restriction endonuclease subunit S n=1 Tax=Halomonas sp. 25-S5 TaxID=2994065 RepID=UPI0024683A40|nr:restriction endonuclease subunit S [Halomonas sp. 25-S5]
MSSSWDRKPLGDLCIFTRGLTYKKVDEDYASNSIVLRATNVDLATNSLNFDELKRIKDNIPIPDGKKVKKGSLLICTASGSKAHLGKVALIDADYGYAFGGFMGQLTPTDSLDAKYFYYLLISESYKKFIGKLADGANINNLKFSQLESFQIPLPPLPEQKRIVAILDEAFAGIDTVVANTEKNLANARELFEASVVHRIFGDPDAKGWGRSTVEGLALQKRGAIRTGPFGSQLLHSEFVDEGIAVLGIDNAVNNEFSWGKSRFITEEKYEALKRYTVKPGDVVITIMGTCGRCAIVPNDIPTAINTKHLCCITLDQDRCLPEFLHGYFLYHPVAREYLEKHAKGSIMAGLNMGIIKSLPVRLPDLSEQSRIAEEIDNLRNEALRLEAIYQQKLTALAELKQSLLQKAFSGELMASKAEAAVEEATA